MGLSALYRVSLRVRELVDFGEIIPCMETLRISPKFTADDWDKLNMKKKADWPQAVAIVRDRLHGRFIHFADKCLKDEFSGFVVLSIDCLLVETIQQFIDGRKHSKKKSAKVFKKFLERPQFQPHFADEKTRDDFYDDIRCGLLHQAEAKNKWLVRRKQSDLLKDLGADGYIINVGRFHAALKESLEDYFILLCQPESKALRGKLWNKMGFICSARRARGVMETLDPAAATPTA